MLNPKSKTTHRRVTLLSLLALLLTLNYSVPLTAQVQVPDAPDDPGAMAFVQNCIRCHAGVLTNMELLNTSERTTQTLDAAVRRMIQYTGPLTEKQITDLTELMKDTDFKFRLADAKLTQDEINATASAATSGTTAAAVDPDNDTASKLFIVSCIKCHTGALAGTDLVNLSTRSTTYLDTAVRRMQIVNGPLTDAQVADLVTLLHDPQMKTRLVQAKASSDATPGASASSAATSTAANWVVAGATTPSASISAAKDSAAAAGTSTSEAPADGSASETDTAAIQFSQSCAGCHTLGTGAPRTGPDLARVATWTDPDLSAAVKRMESKVGPMTDPQVKGLVDLLKDPKLHNRIDASEQKKMQAQTASMDQPSTGTGDLLFHGGMAFANGGVACSACHIANGKGGTMGLALNDVFKRLGDTALQSAITQANFPVMSAAFRDHKITPQEAIHLSAYLASVSEAGPAASNSSGSVVSIIALAGTLLFLGAIGLMSRKRSTRNIRSKLVRRQ